MPESALRYALDSLKGRIFVVVGDVFRDGAAKVAFGQEKEVVQALPPQASHEPLDVVTATCTTLRLRSSMSTRTYRTE
jgi:hypothetical protein